VLYALPISEFVLQVQCYKFTRFFNNC